MLALLLANDNFHRLRELCLSHCTAVTDYGIEQLTNSNRRLEALSVDGIGELSNQYRFFFLWQKE